MHTFSTINWYLTSVDFLKNAMKMLQRAVESTEIKSVDPPEESNSSLVP